ncbi:MAG: glutaminase [Flammeovirgaceae bacterium]
MNINQILQEIAQETTPFQTQGELATYIPELAHVNPNQFGVHVISLEGNTYQIGDSQVKFSIQSISKVLSLSLAIHLVGEQVWERIDVEPSGDPFNSLVLLESENGIPRNPLINSGAIVIADILVSQLNKPKADFLAYVRKISGTSTIDFNLKVAASEKAFGYRNAALANLIKSFGNLEGNIDEVLDFYFHQCAIEMTCAELAKSFLLFANHGDIPESGEQILSKTQTKRLNALMQTCGFYDEAGEFAFKVGLPGKSGVGGGIVAIHPRDYSIAVWSPKLNPKGNSVLGMKALELFTTKTGLSIF